MCLRKCDTVRNFLTDLTLVLERAYARARRPVLNADPAIHKPDKPGPNSFQSLWAFLKATLGQTRLNY